MAAESSPPATESVTTAAGPPIDAALLEWLDSLPCKYQRFSAGEPGRVSDRILLTYSGPGFMMPQDLTETMQRHGYVFRQAAPGVLIFQRVGSKTA